MDHKNRNNSRNYKNQNNRGYNKDKKQLTPQTYRFRRVLGDILNYLKSLPDKETFKTCQNQYESQLTELLNNGFTWGYSYPIPVHDTDFGALEKKEWAAIRAIVRKQEYGMPKQRR